VSLLTRKLHLDHSASVAQFQKRVNNDICPLPSVGQFQQTSHLLNRSISGEHS